MQTMQKSSARFLLINILVQGLNPISGFLFRLGLLKSMSRTILFTKNLSGNEWNIIDTPTSLKRPKSLRNKYFGLRHGESEANVEGIISSSPSVGCYKHGLTSSGIIQARKAATFVIEKVGRTNLTQLIILSSDFRRAKETSLECLDAMREIAFEKNNSPEIDPNLGKEELQEYFLTLQVNNRIELRERYFGNYEGSEVTNYHTVWSHDIIDAGNRRNGVESVTAVLYRVASMIKRLESQYSGKFILLSSHGDTLQILNTYLAGVDCRTFCQYKFRNGEVRDLEKLPIAKSFDYR